MPTVVDREGQTSRGARQAPRQAAVDAVEPAVPEVQGDELEGMSPVSVGGTRRHVTPIRAIVIYLGNHPHKSVAHRGQTVLTPFTDRATGKKDYHRSIPEEPVGTQTYDFARLDSVGQIITARLVKPYPAGHLLAPYTGRPYQWVDHPDHLFAFATARGLDGQPEFTVLTTPEQTSALQEHFNLRARISKTAADAVEETIKNA